MLYDGPNPKSIIKSEMYYGQGSRNLLNYKFLLANWSGKNLTLQRNMFVYDYTLSVKRRLALHYS